MLEFKWRPKTPGLWIQVETRDGVIAQGVYSSFDLLPLADSITVTGPDRKEHTYFFRDLKSAVILGTIKGGKNGGSKAAPRKAKLTTWVEWE